MDRVRCQLAIQTEAWACERVFLGALMVASKVSKIYAPLVLRMNQTYQFFNDRSLRNVHWSICTGCLGLRDVGRIERDFLEALQWKLTVSEAQILDYHDAVIALYPSPYFRRPSPTLFIPLDDIESLYSEDSDSCSSAESTPSPVTPSTPASLVHTKPLSPYDAELSDGPGRFELSSSQRLVDYR
jgi:hypothetical protein